jgi:hypothetical protein
MAGLRRRSAASGPLSTAGHRPLPERPGGDQPCGRRADLADPPGPAGPEPGRLARPAGPVAAGQDLPIGSGVEGGLRRFPRRTIPAAAHRAGPNGPARGTAFQRARDGLAADIGLGNAAAIVSSGAAFIVAGGPAVIVARGPTGRTGSWSLCVAVASRGECGLDASFDATGQSALERAHAIARSFAHSGLWDAQPLLSGPAFAGLAFTGLALPYRAMGRAALSPARRCPGLEPGRTTAGRSPGLESGRTTASRSPELEPGRTTAGRSPELEPGRTTAGRSPGLEPGRTTAGRSPELEPGWTAAGRWPGLESGRTAASRSPELESGRTAAGRCAGLESGWTAAARWPGLESGWTAAGRSGRVDARPVSGATTVSRA